MSEQHTHTQSAFVFRENTLTFQAFLYLLMYLLLHLSLVLGIKISLIVITSNTHLDKKRKL